MLPLPPPLGPPPPALSSSPESLVSPGSRERAACAARDALGRAEAPRAVGAEVHFGTRLGSAAVCPLLCNGDQVGSERPAFGIWIRIARSPHREATDLAFGILEEHLAHSTTDKHIYQYDIQHLFRLNPISIWVALVHLGFF